MSDSQDFPYVYQFKSQVPFSLITKTGQLFLSTVVPFSRIPKKQTQNKVNTAKNASPLPAQEWGQKNYERS